MTTTKLTPAKVRKVLAKEFPGVTFYRSPSGYYYFGGEGCFLPSLYWYDLDGVEIETILDHVRENMR